MRSRSVAATRSLLKGRKAGTQHGSPAWSGRMALHHMTWLWRWVRRAVFAAVLVLITLIVGGAYDARRRHPDLKPWHRVRLDDVDGVDARRSVHVSAVSGARRAAVRRRSAPSSRRSIPRIARRSTAIIRAACRIRRAPAATGIDPSRPTPPAIRGGALLVHGLTDSPYSMRKRRRGAARSRHLLAVAAHARARHASPRAWSRRRWEDWLAAVRMGVRHVRSRIPEGAPLVLVGYSNGGALALKYTLDVIERARRPAAVEADSAVADDRRDARRAGSRWWISLLGVVPYFEKANWLDVFPEYNPFKYNSFAANAGFQTASLTRTIRRRSRAGRGQRPARRHAADPHLSVDRRRHGEHAGGGEHALRSAAGERQRAGAVRRQSSSRASTSSCSRRIGRWSQSLLERTPRRYRRVVVTNDVAGHPRRRGADDRTRIVDRDAPAARTGLAARGVLADARRPAVRARTIRSMASTARTGLPGLLPIGRLSPRGERAVLTVGTDTLMRLSSNPFFPFVAERIGQWLNSDPERSDER